MVRGWFRKNGADLLGIRSPPKSLFQLRRRASTDTSKGLSYDDETLSEETSMTPDDTTTSKSTSVGSSLIKRPPSKRLIRRLTHHRHNNSHSPPPSSINLQKSARAATGSVKNALYTLMGNEDLTDVRIHGSDGGNVVAVRALLAARSPVFRARFYGGEVTTDGQESVTITHSNRSKDDSLDDVLLGDNRTPEADGGKLNVTFQEWDCRILYLIVEYCYTDHLTLLTVAPSDEIARIMALLRSACKYFHLAALLQKVDDWSDLSTSRYPAIACAMIDEGMRLDDIAPRAIRTIQIRTEEALLPAAAAATAAATAGSGAHDDVVVVGGGVCAFSKPGLMFILRFLEDKASHTLLYDAIMTWVNTSSSSSTNETTEGGRGLYSNPARARSGKFMFASRCAKRFIKVTNIDPNRIMEVVKSGLIDVEKGPTVDQYWSASSSSLSLSIGKED